MRRSALWALSCCLVIAVGSVSAAEEDPTEDETVSEKRQRFALKVGGDYVDFSTSFEQVLSGGEQIYVSLEGDLGLPRTKRVPVLSLLARIGEKSYLAADLGRFNRSKTLLELDETLHLDDLVIEASGDVELFVNVDEIDLAYGHAYVDDGRVRIIGKYGLSLLDLSVGVVAEGSYRIGVIDGEGRYEVSTSLFVPVPLFGVLFDVDLSRRWGLASSVEFFWMPVGDITAKAWRARIDMSYSFSRLVKANFGYGTFDIEVVEETDRAKSTVAYTMNGFSAGLEFTF